MCVYKRTEIQICTTAAKGSTPRLNVGLIVAGWRSIGLRRIFTSYDSGLIHAITLTQPGIIEMG